MFSPNLVIGILEDNSFFILMHVVFQEKKHTTPTHTNRYLYEESELPVSISMKVKNLLNTCSTLSTCYISIPEFLFSQITIKPNIKKKEIVYHKASNHIHVQISPLLFSLC